MHQNEGRLNGIGYKIAIETTGGPFPCDAPSPESTNSIAQMNCQVSLTILLIATAKKVIAEILASTAFFMNFTANIVKRCWRVVNRSGIACC